MCGIAGILAFRHDSEPVSTAEIERILAAMRSRGPDGADHWIDSMRSVGLGHRRLSIIDLSDQASQPMWSADRRYVITFNGEIYNYPALRAELADQGAMFRTTSDTEVLLHLFARFGDAMVTRLRGMFAFAIWDTFDRRLFLARDAFGIKPLYYSTTSGTFRFASQVRALVASGAISATPDCAGWVGFYLLGSVPEPFTTYEAIQALPAGTTMRVDQAGAHPPQRFHSVAADYATAEATSHQGPQLSFRDALLDSVRHHLVADVPVGCFLSSGVDSCALLALMREATTAPIKAVTLSFAEFQGTAEDEAPLAAIAADRYEAEHLVRIVSRSQFLEDLDKIISAMDQPSIDGLNTYFVSKAAHEAGLKVAISGLGGDELLGGYPSFADVPAWVKACAPFAAVPGLGGLSRNLIRAAQTLYPLGSPKMAGMIEYAGTFAGAYFMRRALYMPWEITEFLDDDFAARGLERLNLIERLETHLRPDPGSAFSRVAALETQFYMRNQLLRDADWASMAHSLELRVPLVDQPLLRLVAQSRNPLSKSDLARAVSPALPDRISLRKKTGFSTPIGEWLSNTRERAGKVGHVSKGEASRVWAQQLVRRWPHDNQPRTKSSHTLRQ